MATSSTRCSMPRIARCGAGSGSRWLRCPTSDEEVAEGRVDRSREVPAAAIRPMMGPATAQEEVIQSMNQVKTTKAGALLVAAMTVLAACNQGGAATTAPTSGGTTPTTAPGSAAATSFVVGVSNTLQGNGWREEMICSINAEALVVGQGLQGRHRQPQHRHRRPDRGHAQPHLRGRRHHHRQPDVATPRSTRSSRKRPTRASPSSPSTRPSPSRSAYVLSNDQENYGYLGAKWLFDKLGGTGNVVYMRGIDGVPADTARDTGFKRALAEFPNIKVVKETFTGLGRRDRRPADPGHLLVGHRLRRDLDVRHRHPDRRRVQDRGQGVRADRRRGQQQVRRRTSTPRRRTGSSALPSRTRRPSAAPGVNLALKVKAGETVDQTRDADPGGLGQQHTGRPGKIKAAVDPDLNDYYGVTYNVPDVVDATPRTT